MLLRSLTGLIPYVDGSQVKLLLEATETDSNNKMFNMHEKSFPFSGITPVSTLFAFHLPLLKMVKSKKFQERNKMVLNQDDK